MRHQNPVYTPSTVSSDAEKHCDGLYEQATQRFGLNRDNIENILPCTPFQCDVIDCAADDGRRAVGHVVYEIPKNADLQRLTAAWREVVRQTPALRTCTFTSEAGESFQVVLRESSFSWMHSASLDVKEAVVQDEAAAAMAGPRCNRYVVLEDLSTRRRLLIWTFNHALVDNTVQKRILRRVLTAYEGGEVPCPHVEDTERTVRFWQRHFDGLNASVFPPLPSHLAVPHPREQAEHNISYSNPVQQKWSNTTICRAALAVLLSRYTHSPEALFGVVTEQPHMFEEQGHPIDYPTRTVVPIRVLCAPDQSMPDVIGAITAYDNAIREFGQVGLRNIRRTGDDGSAACGFQTVLLVTDCDIPQAPSCGLHRNVEESDKFVPCTNRALLLNCQMADDSALLVARYDQNVIDPRQINRFLRQLGYLIQQFQSNVDLPLVGQLDVVTAEDCAEIESWNSNPLKTRHALIHDTISKWATNAPTKTAVSAWDGEWTYTELDNVSSRLAVHIQSLDLGQGQAVIPLCFEKSKWVVAAMLAVLKAGRAFTLIDPCDPPARMAQVCRQTSATVTLTSKLHSNTIRPVVSRCIVVDDDFLQSLPYTQDRVKLTVRPQDLAYVIFTSGSTGEPKGIMIEHRGFVSCAIEFGPALGINRHTRALQFASYAFGACLVEIVTTLMHGGCVCIPSDDDRLNNVPDFIKRSEVNWVILTPSYIGTFQPEDVPGLQTLVLVGEPISASIRDTWASQVRLLNAYGQSESSTMCSVIEVSPSSLEPNNIGRAVGSRSWIIDPNDPNRLAPIGCIGELVIESPGIARDYIIAPPADKSPFLLTPLSWYPTRKLPNSFKFYRTGDLVRYGPDGTVICLGRRDSQVKIRGQRVEISAVEAHLRKQLPSHIMPVAEAVKRSGSSSSTILIAFLIGSPDGGEDSVCALSGVDAHILDHVGTKEMNATLQQVLPQYSVPSYYIRMKDLPRTATGKADRKTLRSIAQKLLGELAQNGTSQPSEKLDSLANSTEVKLRELWFQSLNLDPGSQNIGASFFDLGGNSVVAIKMVNMARSAGIALKVSDIFQNPTLAGLVDVIGRGTAPYNPIPTTKYSGPVEQSYAQGRLWFLDQLELGASWYLLPYGVRMRGTLHVDALTIALLALEQRHETLRTTFEEHDGAGVQVVHGSLINELKLIDLSGDQKGDFFQSLQEEQTTPFNLASEAGWRVSLIRLGEDDHILSIVMHHIISDGWSIDILRQELGDFYSAALRGRDPLSVVSPLPIHYRDFSVWQKRKEQVAEHQRQLEYWTNQLTDSSPAEFLIDFPRPTILSGKAGFVPVTIDGELYTKLREFCKAHQMTSFSVLLAVFRAAHYRLTGAEDVIIGTPIANRNRQELENMIGFFVNTQCMRITVGDDDTFESLARQVRSTATAAFEHQDVPFERIVSALLPRSRDVSRNPLAQLMFALHSQQDLGKFELEGLEAEPLLNEVYTRFDVEFHLFQGLDSLSGNLVFAADLFELETIQNVVTIFYQVLRHGLDQPLTPIAILPLTDGLVEPGNVIERTEYPRESSVIDVFRNQVDSDPHAIAVIDSASRLTYEELDHQSDQLATWLREQNMAAETLVGVLAPRSCQTVVAIIGILKANLAYLPLDVNCPTARLKTILSTLTGHKLILLGSDVVASEVQLPDMELVRIGDTLGPPLNGHAEPNGNAELNGHKDTAMLEPRATSLAYVIFTSGSTGRPKGVMVEHRSIVRLVKGSHVIPKIPIAAKVAHLANIAFDAAVWEIFTALLNGGTLVCIDYMTILDSKALEVVFAQEQINAALLTPALLKQCLANIPTTLGGLDVLVIGGDRLDAQDAIAAQALVPAGVYNAYGPTENGVISTVYNVVGNDSFINGVPIGRAISNSGAYIINSHRQLVPAGVMGELIVTGDGLSRGYMDQTLNFDRFVKVIIDGKIVRAYRTGDRARYRVADDQIEFFGRIDQQVKIRGHRIELAEVERAILDQNSVRDAVVVIQDQGNQEPELVGFVATQGDYSADQDEAGSQVEGWKIFFESNTYADINTINQSAIGNDFKGWTSMYDGSEINKEEMREWLDDTIHTLLDGQLPGHVLEIGTGSGMVLFNLGAGLQSYVGLEPSRSAATFVTNAIKATPALAGKAEVHVGTATDIGRLRGLCPDVVVLNSVVQYFPTPEYLTEVVDTLVRVPGVKRLFFGDIRSHATNRQFLAARALHSLGDKSTKSSVRQKVAEMEEREEELLVDPAFFTALEGRLADQIEHVEILPKNMQATNELSAYRYAAVIHVRGPDKQVRPVYSIKTNDWIDFQASQMDRDTLLRLLQHSTDTLTIAISNIPYSKTIFERRIVESLDDDNKDNAQSSLDGVAWISRVRSDAERCASLSAIDLIQLGEEAGFRVEVSCARQWSQNGALDAVFHRYHSHAQKGDRVLIRFPTDNQARGSANLTNRPLKRLQSRRFASKIRERLQSLLPSYMIPSRIMMIEQMPLNANGKVDRKELARRVQIIPKSQAAPEQAAPLDEIEAILCEEFADVLGMDVGITDHFFKLGGHSLLATKLTARIGRRLNTYVSVRDVFDQPVISDLAATIRRELLSHNPIPTTSYNGHEEQEMPAWEVSDDEIEVVLCKEFAGVFGIEVLITDNFFDLGGHSLMASKLAARISRRLDAPVSVKDIFDHPVPLHLANKIRLTQSKSHEMINGVHTSNNVSFQLLPLEDPHTFIEREIAPQLECSPDTILDVYPATQMQKIFLLNPVTGHPRSPTPFHIDFPPDSDRTTLVRACTSLVNYFDIFRTVFLVAAGELYQVVLKHVDVPIEIIETDENVNSATRAFLDMDLRKPIRLGQPLIRIAILDKPASTLRVILRMSHALYDGLSLEQILRSLHILYNGGSLPTPPNFARYIQHVANSRKGGYDFWRSVLGNSSMTEIKSVSNSARQQVGANHVSKVINVPLQTNAYSNITQATVFTTACALMLSKEAGLNDVVFGRIVSGRQGLPMTCQNVVGPCLNQVPVRVCIDRNGNQIELLREMQDQYLSSLPFETLGFDEIKKNCTNWPEATTNYGCCIVYQNFDSHPDSQVQEQRLQIGVLSRNYEAVDEGLVHDLVIAGEAEPEGPYLRVTVVANRRVCGEGRINHMLEELCENIRTLSLTLSNPPADDTSLVASGRLSPDDRLILIINVVGVGAIGAFKDVNNLFNDFTTSREFACDYEMLDSR
ncbi:non-ribosomal peptide synthetase [Annulohypoxylon maeteangense]|uniref:non-ribosomal peptide synthetase n=1 Tax=Annulohypoxylon maeteangense TaxID=1927788 RepID=UPI002008C463|nr:non-ribosomal peptide synthetase [Annulohypoxylon maeteangense]KAI0882912.1 non-ribosomal peptide synthetase [Annulohypoxylon maeteangense]